MNERKKKEIKTLNQLFKEENLERLYGNIFNELCSNNDFVCRKRYKSFEWALKTYKKTYNSIIKKNIYNYKYLNDIYLNIIRETINYINNNIKSDNLSRFAFIQALFKNNCFSCSEKIPHNYLDVFSFEGIDIILGDGCCRHKSELLKRVLDNYIDTIKVFVGSYEDTPPNHAIISFENNNYPLFLDSTIPLVYFYASNLTLVGIDGASYIKSVPVYLRNQNFKDIKDYYSYFNRLNNTFMLTKNEYEKIYYYIYDSYDYYDSKPELLDGLMNNIESDVKELKYIYYHNYK